MTDDQRTTHCHDCERLDSLTYAALGAATMRGTECTPTQIELTDAACAYLKKLFTDATLPAAPGASVGTVLPRFGFDERA